MIRNIATSRERIAHDRLVSFDFGNPVKWCEHWEADAPDALTCTVHLGGKQGGRHLTFRVVFQPSSTRVRNVDVAECLPVV
ncbi:MAG TPA: hypothetical protein VKS60_08070 [Stellaceae bacterium]|nr:hypothetical protein [Stellaceae bacterium]